MAYNGTNPVSIGNTAKESQYRRAFENTIALYEGALGIASQAAQDFIYASSATQLARLAAVDGKLPRYTTAGGWAMGYGPATPYAATLANVENTVTETTILSFTVPANDWANGDTIFIFMASLNKNNKGSSGVPVVRVNVGAGGQVQIFNSTYGNNAAEYKAIGFACALTRVGSDVWISEPAMGMTPVVASVTEGPFAQGITTVPGISTPTNFTGSNVVSVKATLDAAHATYYIKPQAARVWRQAAA